MASIIPYHFEPESFYILAPKTLVPTIEAAVRTLVPNTSFGSGRQLIVDVSWQSHPQALKVEVQLDGKHKWTWQDEEIFAPHYTAEDRNRRARERVRLGVQRVLEEAFNLSASAWGILAGVRPTKLVHNMLDRGFSYDHLRYLLHNVYALNEEKRELLLDVAKRQRAYFHPSPNDPISIYVGIPFCPTRCSYCSFAAYPMKTHGHLFDNFLQALKLEIEAVGSLIERLGIEVETIYLGGGTPTTVRGRQLRELLALIRKYFYTESTEEFTVEAGRPETLDLETLMILKEAQVNRISINPQTMHNATLKTIGREHSVEQVYTAFYLAREVGIPIINMDIILGLPGEKVDHVAQTLEKISSLKPDNLTVHSLSLKRASRLKKNLEEAHIAQEQGEAMVALTRKTAISWEMIPYYLYRQRHILGDMENIGYAISGTESRYNVQMMEERQTVIALGGGAISKLVAADLSLVRLINPKCPATYTRHIKEGLDSKIDQIRKHLLV